MKLRTTVVGLLLVLSLVVAACGASNSGPDASSSRQRPAAEALPTAETAVSSREKQEDVAAMTEDEADVQPDADTAMAEDKAADLEPDANSAVTEDREANSDDGNLVVDVEDAHASQQEADAVAQEVGSIEHNDRVGAQNDNAMAADEGGAQDPVQQDDATMVQLEETEEEPLDLPAWFNAELVNVNSGDTFTIADQRGKVVLLETLAVWCSNCLRQQKEVKALHEALGERDDLVSIGLDIDLNESIDQLRAHADRNDFDWVYAVATPAVAREIGQLYGNLFLNPPSTPMLIISRDGQVHPLPFGIKSAGELQQALAPFLTTEWQ